MITRDQSRVRYEICADTPLSCVAVSSFVSANLLVVAVSP